MRFIEVCVCVTEVCVSLPQSCFFFVVVVAVVDIAIFIIIIVACSCFCCCCCNVIPVSCFHLTDIYKKKKQQIKIQHQKFFFLHWKTKHNKVFWRKKTTAKPASKRFIATLLLTLKFETTATIRLFLFAKWHFASLNFKA